MFCITIKHVALVHYLRTDNIIIFILIIQWIFFLLNLKHMLIRYMIVMITLLNEKKKIVIIINFKRLFRVRPKQESCIHLVVGFQR